MKLTSLFCFQVGSIRHNMSFQVHLNMAVDLDNSVLPF